MWPWFKYIVQIIHLKRRFDEKSFEPIHSAFIRFVLMDFCLVTHVKSVTFSTVSWNSGESVLTSLNVSRFVWHWWYKNSSEVLGWLLEDFSPAFDETFSRGLLFRLADWFVPVSTAILSSAAFELFNELLIEKVVHLFDYFLVRAVQLEFRRFAANGVHRAAGLFHIWFVAILTCNISFSILIGNIVQFKD